MPKGKVKEYEPARECGTIIDSDTGEELTVYANYLKLGEGVILKEGQTVEYEIERSRHTSSIRNLRVL